MAPVSADSKANSLITKVNRDLQGGFLSKYSVVQRSEIKWAYLFIAPQMIGLAIFTLGPILYAGYLSFTKWNLFKPPQWVGLENYIDQLQDPTFGNLLRNTFLITAGYIPLVMIVSLAMALALNQKLRFTVIYRLAYFMPVVTSLVAIALVWRWVLQPDFGLVNYLLGLIGIEGPTWLSSTQWAIPGLIFMRVWWGAGFYMIIFLAGLQGIPQEFYDAAKVDGASSWQRFRHVTLPLLSPTTFFVFIMASIWTLQIFDQVYIMTDGGPGEATAVFLLRIYQLAFRYFRMGDAAALSMILFLIIGCFTYFQSRYSRRWVHYDLS